MDQNELNLLNGRINVGGEIIQFTRQEAVLIYIIMNSEDGITLPVLVKHVFGDQTSKNGKTIGVHMCNIRKKIAGTSKSIVYDNVNETYGMGDKNV